jgi:CDP-paratose 2-epimerase
VADLIDLIGTQLDRLADLDGRVFNVGGGLGSSLSLCETTAACRRVVGRSVPVGSVPETREGDVRVYVTDNAAVTAETGWAPRRAPDQVLADTHAWVVAHESALRRLLGGSA